MKIVRGIILATPLIAKGMLHNALDKRVALREMQETEAVELTASTAMHPVNLEAKERPNIFDIVANMERALALCEEVLHWSLYDNTLHSFSLNSSTIHAERKSKQFL